MLFRPEVVSKTWDTSMYYHEGTYYLYYLISEQAPGDGFGVATSQDGIKWKDHGWAIRASDKMVRYLGTGSVWKDPHFAETGRFLCNYSEWRMVGDKMIQNILFAWSEDLIHWAKLGDDSMFRIDEQFYRRVNEDAHGPWEWPRWDGICVVPRLEGGYYGYWTATVVSPNMSNSMQRAALCTSALDFGAYLLIATTCSTPNVPKATFHGSVKCSRC